MTERLRAVFDTNVFVSALLSRNPTSPTQEIAAALACRGVCPARQPGVAHRVSRKAAERGIGQDHSIQELLRHDHARLAEWPWNVPPESGCSRGTTADPDDDQILACATVGKASYLVTYDPHFDLLEGIVPRVSRSSKRCLPLESREAISRLST